MNYQVLEFEHEFFLGFRMFRINEDAVYRADFFALGCIVMADAFRAEIRIDLIDLRSRGNGFVGAFGFANITIDAFVGNE